MLGRGNRMGTNYYLVENKLTTHEPLHIGKASYGWKFCFHDCNEYESWPWNVELHTFKQWEDFINRQVTLRKAIIMNEYDEIVDKEDFFNMVLEKQKINNPDDFTYSKNVDGYRFEEGEFV